MFCGQFLLNGLAGVGVGSVFEQGGCLIEINQLYDIGDNISKNSDKCEE